jgi:plastocyanin
MTRLAGITSLYALIAALLLVTPLSASEDPVPEPVASAEALEQPQDAVTESTEHARTVPEATSPEPPPAEVTPPTEPAPLPPPAPESAAPSLEPAAPAVEAQEQPGQAKPKPRPSKGSPRATAAADTGVTISDFRFAPASVTIDVGDTVTWTNEGPTPHSATADDRSFDTGIFEAGQSRSHTFDEAGTFAYFCTPHPNMRGTVTVRAASTGRGGGGSGGGGGDTGGGSGDGGGGAGGGSGTGSGTSGTGSGTSGTGSGTSGDSSGTALPATGLDAGGLALLGLMTLALGAFLRRRAAAE